MADSSEAQAQTKVQVVPKQLQTISHLEALPTKGMIVFACLLLVMVAGGLIYLFIASLSWAILYMFCVLMIAVLAIACTHWPGLSRVLVTTMAIWILFESLLLVILVIYAIVLDSTMHALATFYTVAMFFACLLGLRFSYDYLRVFKNNQKVAFVQTVS